uniref:Kinase n=1 Tax=Dermatophagoides pteronyssinus TaxID=6956 RepID=A0A6P6XXP3_DERPT|nr:inositol hexakisphosphate kinase 2-like isoform X1 [Dermatophagoides pteronyssinus]
MLLNQYTLCKPLIPKELDFYLNIPRQLFDFVPRYKGVVKICHNESMLPILYHPIRNLSSSSNNNKHQSNENQQKPELRVRLSICNDDHRLLESIRIDHFEQQQQQRGYSSRPNQKYFMLLENITSNYHLPCILDLKMGTRQHSDDASDEKRRRQMAKCASTTSATLGIRICGMQVYQKKLSSSTTSTTSKNQYKLYQRDKYHGRRIKNENGFRNELEIYFHNRTYLIRPIISRLKQLKLKIIETLRQTTLRFFSTSLLIVTEGCLDVVNRHNHRHHHHHHRRFSDDEEEEEEEDADSNSDDSDDEQDNYFYQYDNFYTAQNDIIANNDHDDDDDDDDDECTSSSLDSMTEESPSTSTSFNNVDNNKDILFNCNRDHPHYSRSSSATTCTNNIPGFDIRLIDFAHTSFNYPSSSTSSSSSPPPSTSSCDYGFILGIDNLIRLLNEILFDAIRARVSMNHNHHHQQQRLNKRRRSSNGQNWLQFPHIYPTNKKLINCNFNNNNDNDDCDD